MMRVLGLKKTGEGNEVASYAPVLKALSALKRSSRLKGTVFIHEGIILGADTDLTDKQNSDFVREINALVSQYRNGGRTLSRALFGFDAGAVLIFHKAPFLLCLLFLRLEDAGEVEKQGEKFLQTWSKALKIKSPEEITLPLFDLKKALEAQAAPAVSEQAFGKAIGEGSPVVAGISDLGLKADESSLPDLSDEPVSLAVVELPEPTQTELPLVAEGDEKSPEALEDISNEVEKDALELVDLESGTDSKIKVESEPEELRKSDLTGTKAIEKKSGNIIADLKLTEPKTESKPDPKTESETKPSSAPDESETPAELITVDVDESDPVEPVATPESSSSLSDSAEPSLTPIPDQLMNLSSSDPGETWNSFRQKIENLLSKVLGRAQAVRLIERELDSIGIASGAYLLAPQFRPFGQKLMQKVKDKALRNQLEIELIALIEEHQK